MLFGGLTWGPDVTYHSDTWELGRGGWTLVDEPARPVARHRGASAFDAVRGRTVLFGGQAASLAMLSDTWHYEDRRWRQQRHWWTRPTARAGHSMAFDETIGKTVLFGGVGHNDVSLGDTWLFDGERWERLSLRVSPSPRRYAAFAYDPGKQGCVLHGGSADDQGRRMHGDAWLFQDGRWSRLPGTHDTDPRDDQGLAFDRTSRRLVMLEGALCQARRFLALSATGWQAVTGQPLHPAPSMFAVAVAREI